MASLYISYFGGVDKFCPVDPLGSEVVTTSGTSAQSGTVRGTVACLYSDAAHYVAQGANPTAAAGATYIPANQPFWLRLAHGQKLAAVTV